MYGGLARLNASQKSGPSQHPRVEVSDVNLKTHCLEKKVEHVAIIPIHTFIRASYMNLSRHFSLIAKNTLKTAHTPTPPYPTLSYPVPAISTSASSSSSSSSGMNRFPSSLYQNHIHIHIRHHMKANVSKSASRITHARTQPPPPFLLLASDQTTHQTILSPQRPPIPQAHRLPRTRRRRKWRRRDAPRVRWQAWRPRRPTTSTYTDPHRQAHARHTRRPVPQPVLVPVPVPVKTSVVHRHPARSSSQAEGVDMRACMHMARLRLPGGPRRERRLVADSGMP